MGAALSRALIVHLPSHIVAPLNPASPHTDPPTTTRSIPAYAQVDDIMVSRDLDDIHWAAPAKRKEVRGCLGLPGR